MLENIAQNENEVEVLIFKQAIALDDCPRYKFLLYLETGKHLVFQYRLSEEYDIVQLKKDITKMIV